MGYVIRQFWQGQQPRLVRIYDPETKLQRDAWFSTKGDAMEACSIISRIITASTFEGTELVEEPDKGETATSLLTDAMVMLKAIKRNREMPPFAQTQQQYVALGERIEKFLNSQRA